MTSHGHGVARASRPRTEEQRQIDLGKIQRYRDLEDQIRQKAAHKDYSQATFELTSKLLRLNPEYYTVWNIRRRCLISGLLSAPSPGSWPSKASPSSSATATHTRSSDDSSQPSSKETQLPQDSPTTGKSGTIAEQQQQQPWKSDLETITAELGFTVPLLMEFPKCYWIWNYRLWVLNEATERLPTPAARKVWETELGLIGKMLHRDARNFHAWGYRRFVVEHLEDPQLDGESMVEAEFAYSTSKIEANLSNFSAWHHRSQLIPRLLRERNADDKARRSFLESELAYVQNGLNVGPEDQSLWFYHQYLISNLLEPAGPDTIAPSLTDEERITYVQREIDEIRDLLEDYTNIKWIYEALVGYTSSLSLLAADQGAIDNQDDLRHWVSQLRALDPRRAGRWTDLEKKLALA